jgi:hypothetical protein
VKGSPDHVTVILVFRTYPILFSFRSMVDIVSRLQGCLIFRTQLILASSCVQWLESHQCLKGVDPLSFHRDTKGPSCHPFQPILYEYKSCHPYHHILYKHNPAGFNINSHLPLLRSCCWKLKVFHFGSLVSSLPTDCV